jgi:hypothetical protein
MVLLLQLGAADKADALDGAACCRVLLMVQQHLPQPSEAILKLL